MREGIEIFARWGLARPVAFRAGNFEVGAAVYRAMAPVGLRTASNVAFGAVRPADNGSPACAPFSRVTRDRFSVRTFGAGAAGWRDAVPLDLILDAPLWFSAGRVVGNKPAEYL
jgi:hypothetical protein